MSNFYQKLIYLIILFLLNSIRIEFWNLNVIIYQWSPYSCLKLNSLLLILLGILGGPFVFFILSNSSMQHMPLSPLDLYSLTESSPTPVPFSNRLLLENLLVHLLTFWIRFELNSFSRWMHIGLIYIILIKCRWNE